MADAPTNTNKLNDQSTFVINGIRPFKYTDASDYISMAHGVLCFFSSAAAECGGVSKLTVNDDVSAAALQAAETLLEHAALCASPRRSAH